jgi:hypothetical protein
MTSKDKPAPWPYYGPDEIAAVSRILRSGKVNQWTGKEVFTFEKEYAAYLGLNYAVALSSGSVALDLALTALGIDKGDEVIVPCRSFVASASCVALRGATPVFCDIDRESQNVTVEEIEKVFTKRTKAVIAVHLSGWPCELDKLRNFCNKKKIYLIEDCAQAHGANYKGKPVGSFGDVSCFSFCQDKIISTAGEGGLLATNNKKIWQKVWSLKDHGRNYNKMFGKKSSGGFVWSVKDFGSNYRMTEIQAAVGRLALKKLDKWVSKRRKLTDILTQGFKKFSQLRVTVPSNEVYHSYYKYYVFTKPERLKPELSRDKIIDIFNREGIACGSGICPEIYREKAFQTSGDREGHQRLETARVLGETSLMFQVHPTLKKSQMHRIVDLMKEVLG